MKIFSIKNILFITIILSVFFISINNVNAEVFDLNLALNVSASETGTSGLRFIPYCNTTGYVNITKSVLSNAFMGIIMSQKTGGNRNLTLANASFVGRSALVYINLTAGKTYYAVGNGTTVTYAFPSAGFYPNNKTNVRFTGASPATNIDNDGAYHIDGVGTTCEGSGEPPPTPTYIINLTSTIINTTNPSSTFTLKVLNYTNTNLTNPTAILYGTINTTLNNGCGIFYQTICIDNFNYKSYLMNKINNTYFNLTLNDNILLPAYYPYNFTYIDNTIHSNISIYQQRNIIFNITNFSTQVSQFNINLEFYSENKSSTSTNMLIYYCNSSYSDSNPSTNNNCLLVDSFTPTTTYKHTHNNSKHQVIPITI